MNNSWEFKLECVEAYLKGRWVEKPECAKCSTKMFHDKIVLWTRIYKVHGVDGLKHNCANKEWTAEGRFELVARVLVGESITSVSIDVAIDKGLLSQWVRKYKTKGYDRLKLLKKGRPSKKSVMRKDDKTKKLTKSEKEELILLREQVEYLRAENAYLKKLRALIVKKQAESSVKAKKQPLSEDSEKKDID